MVDFYGKLVGIDIQSSHGSVMGNELHPLRFNMLHLKNKDLGKEIPALESIIFRFDVEFWRCNQIWRWELNGMFPSLLLVSLVSRFPTVSAFAIGG